MIYDIKLSSQYENMFEVFCNISPNKLITHDVNLNIRMIDKSCIIQKLLITFKFYNNKHHINNLYLVGAVHANAIHEEKKIYPLIQQNNALYRFCLDSFVFRNELDFNEQVDLLIYQLSWWDFTTCYWKDYSKFKIEYDENTDLFDKITNKFVSVDKIKKRMFWNEMIYGLKNIGSKIFAITPSEFEEGAMSMARWIT